MTGAEEEEEERRRCGVYEGIWESGGTTTVIIYLDQCFSNFFLWRKLKYNCSYPRETQPVKKNIQGGSNMTGTICV
jgi:hypothetical protein